MNVTKELARFICETDYSILPPEAVELSKQHIFDTVAVAIAGLNDPVGTCITAYGRRLGGQPVCTVIGSTYRTNPQIAALVNATLSHVHDYDDDSVSTVTHPSPVLVPAIFAVAEDLESSGKEMITAYVVGLEVISQISSIVNLKHYFNGWHPTATLGVFGAAAGCAKLMNLSEEHMINAIGMAASLSSGIRGNFGTMTKPLHSGQAAQNGVMAAYLAADGFSAHSSALETFNGFFEVYCGDGHYSTENARKPGKPFEVVSPGTNFKNYPCCSGLHAAIDAALHLVSTYDITPDQVVSVEAVLDQMVIDILAYDRPATPKEAKFSMNFALASAICLGKVGLKEFLPENVLRSDIQEMMKNVTVSKKEGTSGNDWAVDARVIIRLKNGKIYDHTVDACIGHAVYNPFSREDLIRKFRECCEFSSCTVDIQTHTDLILEDFENLPDVKAVMNLLSALETQTPKG